MIMIMIIIIIIIIIINIMAQSAINVIKNWIIGECNSTVFIGSWANVSYDQLSCFTNIVRMRVISWGVFIYILVKFPIF